MSGVTVTCQRLLITAPHQSRFLLMPILDSWAAKKSISFPNYAADSWGPEAAVALIAKDGFHWFTLPLKNKK